MEGNGNENVMAQVKLKLLRCIIQCIHNCLQN